LAFLRLRPSWEKGRGITGVPGNGYRNHPVDPLGLPRAPLSCFSLLRWGGNGGETIKQNNQGNKAIRGGTLSGLDSRSPPSGNGSVAASVAWACWATREIPVPERGTGVIIARTGEPTGRQMWNRYVGTACLSSRARRVYSWIEGRRLAGQRGGSLCWPLTHTRWSWQCRG
jgi:hypothetical protein